MLKSLRKLEKIYQRPVSLLSNRFSSNLELNSDDGIKSQTKKNFLPKNGPGLKEFLARDHLAEINNSGSDEALSNDIFMKNLDNLKRYTTDGTSIVEKRKVFFEVHGCQMNVNDTEVAYAILDKTGRYERTVEEQEADVVLIMTCSIRENSEQKIWNRLREFCFQKRHNPGMQIGVLGCMAERLKDKIVNKERLVDVVCGPDSYRLLPTLLEQSLESGNAAVNVQLSLEETYAEISPLRIYPASKMAYISIQRGCDNMCSFCIVPFTRGRERSRPISSIVDEVKKLSESGIREVMLLGQNVNSYLDKSEFTSAATTGPDLSTTASKTELSRGFRANYKLKSTAGARTFVELLDRVSLVNPEMRVRFTSPHPKDFPDQLLHLIRDRPNICRTMHLPAQSGSSSCLERMRRGYTREAYLDLAARIREIVPDMAFTSDFIAGFCEETDDEHAETISLMKLMKYSFCFMYTYSMREKTRAFHRLADNVLPEVKQKRYLEMVDTFRVLADELNNSKLGQVHLVLVDQVSKRSVLDLSGRNDNNTLVVFERTELPTVRHASDLLQTNRGDGSKSMPQVGDYVACRLVKATSQSFRGVPLFKCNLLTFDSLKREINLNGFDYQRLNSVDKDQIFVN